MLPLGSPDRIHVASMTVWWPMPDCSCRHPIWVWVSLDRHVDLGESMRGRWRQAWPAATALTTAT